MKHPCHRFWVTGQTGIILLLVGMLGFDQAILVAKDAPKDKAQTGHQTTDLQTYLQLDIPALLLDDADPKQALTYRIWTLEPKPGRLLLRLPIRIAPLSQDITLKTSTVGIARTRFIAWHLPDWRQDTQPKSKTSNLQENALTPLQPLEGMLDFRLAQMGVPRLTRRKVLLHANGSMTWSMDSKLVGGSVATNNDNLYTYRLNRKRLAEERPTLPGQSKRKTQSALKSRRTDNQQRRPRNNNTARSNRDQRAKLRAAYQEEKRIYQALSKSVLQLPNTFTDRRPTRLWLIAEASPAVKELLVRGLEGGDWTISLEKLNLLRNFAQNKRAWQNRRPGTANDNALFYQADQLLKWVTEQPHPSTQQSVAFALTQGKFANQIRPLGKLYQLYEKLLFSNDQSTRHRVLAELLALNNLSPGVIQLLQKVSQGNDPQISHLAFGHLLQAAIKNPTQLTPLLTQANQLLNRPDNISPIPVLKALLDASFDQPQIADQLIAQMRFGRIPSSQLDLTIGFIISQAGTHPVAGGWLDQQLLGSTQRQLVKRTLEQFAFVQTHQPTIAKQVNHLLTAWLGKPAAGLPQRARATIQMDQLIYIPSTQHHLFGILQHGDAALRQLGWRALQHFVFDPQGDPTQSKNNRRKNKPLRTGQKPANQRPVPMRQLMLDPYHRLVAIALSLHPTPDQAANFLARQQDLERATLGLVRLTTSASAPAFAQAAGHLIHSRRPLAMAMRQLAPADRRRFANRLYLAKKQTPPRVTALLAALTVNENLSDWFGGYVALHNRLPARQQWGSPFGGEDALLDIVATAQDSQLYLASVDALVAMSGGPAKKTAEVAKLLKAHVDGPRSKLLPIWKEQRRKIYLGVIQAQSGYYQLSLHVFDNMPSDKILTPSQPSEQILGIGVSELALAGSKIQFRGSPSVKLSLSPDQLAIVLSDIADLEDMANPKAIRQLNLSKIQREKSITLLPNENGLWYGHTRLADGRPIMLVMTPVTEPKPKPKPPDPKK